MNCTTPWTHRHVCEGLCPRSVTERGVDAAAAEAPAAMIRTPHRLKEQQDLSRSDDLELRNELCQDVKVLPICLSEIVPRLDNIMRCFSRRTPTALSAGTTPGDSVGTHWHPMSL
ncbi:unnamed protein product [Symbiodinium natans]|uniref:Uncharacterized protein n=1 Tax=Symbiodinium natans TaxID=878477 RepID=A0A812R7U0_9DINO|nr:unnamed protein product [Symbiodinium natans]